MPLLSMLPTMPTLFVSCSSRKQDAKCIDDIAAAKKPAARGRARV